MCIWLRKYSNIHHYTSIYINVHQYTSIYINVTQNTSKDSELQRNAAEQVKRSPVEAGKVEERNVGKRVFSF